MPGKVTISMGGKKGNKVEYARTMGDRSGYAQDLMAVGGAKMLEQLNRVAAAAAAYANESANELYERREGRRHKKGTRHLHGSFSAKVVGTPPTGRKRTPQFPFTIVLTSSADAIKVSSLNSGAKPHIISAKNAPFLRFPMAGVGYAYKPVPGARRNTLGRISPEKRFAKSPGAVPQAKAQRGRWARIPEVRHPGIRPSYFMELAVERAVDQVLRKRVRLPRK